MMKKIGIMLATLCAGLALAIPQAASAADRDDYNNRPTYQYSEGRSYEAYTPQVRFRNDSPQFNIQRDGNNYRANRHSWQAQRRQTWNNRDRDDNNRYER